MKQEEKVVEAIVSCTLFLHSSLDGMLNSTYAMPIWERTFIHHDSDVAASGRSLVVAEPKAFLEH
jgi:hypothetical protein